MITKSRPYQTMHVLVIALLLFLLPLTAFSQSKILSSKTQIVMLGDRHSRLGS